MVNNREGRDGSIQSVDRAISILQVLAQRGASGVTEIGAALGTHKSTVFRLLSTLEARGLVEQTSSRGRYQLGYGVVQLAAGATRKHDLSVTSRPICQELAETVGETVNIAIYDGQSVVSIDQVIGSASVTTVNWVGQRSPVHATAAGKVFLAYMPLADLRTTLAGGLERFTVHTIVDPSALERELESVAEQGYASSLEEHEIGLAAVAAPIRNLDREVVAALTISGPNFRINGESIPDVAEQVKAAAAAISELNGFPKPG